MCLFVPKSEAVRLGIEPCELDPGAEVLFIFSGAFTGMNDIIKNRVRAPGERSADSNDSNAKPGITWNRCRYQIHGISG